MELKSQKKSKIKKQTVYRGDKRPEIEKLKRKEITITETRKTRKPS